MCEKKKVSEKEEQARKFLQVLHEKEYSISDAHFVASAMQWELEKMRDKVLDQTLVTQS